MRAMASWTIPESGETVEWAFWIATDYLERQRCDETCRALSALLSSDLARHVLAHTDGAVQLEIDHATDHVELRVSGHAIRPGAPNDPEDLSLLRRLATTWGSETVDDRNTTWCRFRCMVGEPRSFVIHPTGS
jgi:hypothetical protein